MYMELIRLKTTFLLYDFFECLTYFLRLIRLKGFELPWLLTIFRLDLINVEVRTIARVIDKLVENDILIKKNAYRKTYVKQIDFKDLKLTTLLFPILYRRQV